MTYSTHHKRNLFNPKFDPIWILLAVLLFMLVVSLTACVTQEKCNAKFPPVLVSSSIDTTKEKTTIAKSRIDTIRLKGEDIHHYHQVNCDSLNKAQMKKTTVVKKTDHGNLTSSAEIKDGKLEIDCAEDSLMKIIVDLKDSITTIKTTIKSDKQSISIQKVVEWPWWAKPLLLIAIISLLVNVIILFGKAFKIWLSGLM